MAGAMQLAPVPIWPPISAGPDDGIWGIDTARTLLQSTFRADPATDEWQCTSQPVAAVVR
jgi:hypothetical protein